jgi:hypothetical protein
LAVYKKLAHLAVYLEVGRPEVIFSLHSVSGLPNIYIVEEILQDLAVEMFGWLRTWNWRLPCIVLPETVNW